MPLTGTFVEESGAADETINIPAAQSPEVENGVEAHSAPTEQDFENIDPASLPPELQSLYKGMQAAYTKKSQARETTLKASQEKAQAFEKIVADPEYRRAFLAALGQTTQPNGTQAPSADEPAWRKVKPSDALEEPTLHAVKAAGYELLDELGVMQTIREIIAYKPMIDQLLNRATGDEFSTIAQKYTGADEHRDAALALLSKVPKGSLTMEQALFAVAGPSLKAPTKEPAQPENRSVDKRQAQLLQNATSSVNGRPTTKKISLLDLVAKHVNEQRQRGS